MAITVNQLLSCQSMVAIMGNQLLNCLILTIINQLISVETRPGSQLYCLRMSVRSPNRYVEMDKQCTGCLRRKKPNWLT